MLLWRGCEPLCACTCACPCVLTAGVHAHTHVNLCVYSCACVCMPSMQTLLSPQRTLSQNFIQSQAALLGQCGVQAPYLGKLSVPPPPSSSAAPPLLLQGSSRVVDLEASETLLRALSLIIDIFLKACVRIMPRKVAWESCCSELLGFTALSGLASGAHTVLQILLPSAASSESKVPQPRRDWPSTPHPPPQAILH